jgi:hypothetical protein
LFRLILNGARKYATALRNARAEKGFAQGIFRSFFTRSKTHTPANRPSLVSQDITFTGQISRLHNIMPGGCGIIKYTWGILLELYIIFFYVYQTYSKHHQFFLKMKIKFTNLSTIKFIVYFQ